LFTLDRVGPRKRKSQKRFGDRENLNKALYCEKNFEGYALKGERALSVNRTEASNRGGGGVGGGWGAKKDAATEEGF